MTTESWIICLGIAALFTITPGPSMLLIISHSLRWGPQQTRASILGNITALAASSCMIAAGWSAVFIASEQAVEALRFAGGAYLVYIGAKYWLTSRDNERTAVTTSSRIEVANSRLYAEALLVSLGNPKTLMFLTSCFSVVVSPNQPLLLQLAQFAATFMLASYLSLTLYAHSAAKLKAMLNKPASMTFAQRTAGTLFIGSGAAMLISRR